MKKKTTTYFCFSDHLSDFHQIWHEFRVYRPNQTVGHALMLASTLPLSCLAPWIAACSYLSFDNFPCFVWVWVYVWAMGVGDVGLIKSTAASKLRLLHCLPVLLFLLETNGKRSCRVRIRSSCNRGSRFASFKTPRLSSSSNKATPLFGVQRAAKGPGSPLGHILRQASKRRGQGEFTGESESGETSSVQFSGSRGCLAG